MSNLQRSTTPRVNPAQEVARLKPGTTVTERTALKLLSEPIYSLEYAKERHGRGMNRSVTLSAVAACSDGKWGWFIAASRMFSGNANRRGFRVLIAGPFPTKKAAELRAREHRDGRCISHEDCLGCEEMAHDCYRLSLPISTEQDVKR